MKPVYQTFIDGKRGNCMQAVMASLFELPLEMVPNFIEFGQDWFQIMIRFSYYKGYDLLGHLYNPHECYRDEPLPEREIIPECRFSELQKMQGIKGYWYATVFSQKFYDPSKSWGAQIQHAVIIDKDLNIVHDPNPNNKSDGYLRANEIGYNGILSVKMFEPIKDENNRSNSNS
jgi:hypothetical protein